MGNQHSAAHAALKPRKNVHWKSAGRPAVPGKPEIIPILSDDEPNAITLRWPPATHDGGAPLQGYQVECNRLGSSDWIRTAPPVVLRPELVLTGLEPPHRYQFRVAALNTVGRSDFSELSDVLTVSSDRAAHEPPAFLQHLEDVTALENDQTEFRVSYIGAPAPSIAWFKDDYEIFSSRRTAITTTDSSSVLLFHQTLASDEGEIKCTATNRAGHAVTKARLALEAAPKLRYPRQYEDGLLYEINETVFLKTTIVGKPTPIVEWRHDGHPVVVDDRVEITNTPKFSVLKIHSARRGDRGEYHVHAKNSIGEDTAAFLVTITAPPDPPRRVSVTRQVDKSVTLDWEPPEDDGGCRIGNYVVEYFRTGWNVWLKATTSRKTSATLFDLIEGSEYRFRVKAESPYGMSAPSAESTPVRIPGRAVDMDFLAVESRIISEVLTREDGEETRVSPAPRRKRIASQESSRAPSPAPPPAPSTTAPRMLSPASPRARSPAPSRALSPTSPRARSPAPPRALSPASPRARSPAPPRALSPASPRARSPAPPRAVSPASSPTRSPARLRAHSPALPRASSPAGDPTGSNEFMLVIYPDTKSAEKAEKRKSFQLELEDSLSPPPLSLSAPELSSRHFMPFTALRNAVSSTELLHERAMARFYQAVALEEKQTKHKHTPKPEHNNIPHNTSHERNDLRQIPKVKQTTETSIKTPEIFIKTDSVEDKQYNYNSRQVSLESETSDNKWQQMSFDEDYTASTVSSEEDYSDEGSLDGEADRSHDFNEEDTYNPRDKLARPSPVKEDVEEEEESEREILKPLPLLDPNFVPKPILKRRELEITNTNAVHENEISIPDQKLKKEKPKKEQKMTIFKKLTKMPVQKPFPFTKILNKKSSEKTLEEKTDSDNTFEPTKKVEKMEDKISEERRTVIDYYGSIVKEFGSQKKNSIPLYLKTEDLKSVAEKQQKEKKDKISTEQKKVVKAKRTIGNNTANNKLALPAKAKTGNSVDKRTSKSQLNNDKLKLEKKDKFPEKQAKPQKKITQQVVLKTTERATIVIPIDYKELEEKAKVNVRSAIDYMVDTCLLLLAFWVYFFKDERLAIPFLTLIIYRQLQETLLLNIPQWFRRHTPNWLKKKTS